MILMLSAAGVVAVLALGVWIGECMTAPADEDRKALLVARAFGETLDVETRRWT